MQLLTVAVAILLAHTVQGTCSSLGLSRGVASMDPRELNYDTDAVATITCVDQYIVSWATSVDQVSGQVKCDGTSKWVTPEDVNVVAGGVYCGACTDTISCTEGTCKSGGCDCNPGFKIVDDVRVCEAITCAAPTLTSATADPVKTKYGVDDVIKVTCNAGYHIQKEDDAVIERQITCKDDGHFTPDPPICIVCDDDTDCTEAVCNGGRCECKTGFQFAANSLRVCEKVACTDDYCKNDGVCSVQGSELHCECPKGTDPGDNCETFTVFPCKPDPGPCLNGGVCSRDVTTDITDLTKHTCECTDDFEEGGNCEYAKAFHISTSDPGGVLKSDISAVEFVVTMATTLPDMYIALLQVKDANNALYKVVLKNVGDGSSIAISITEGVGQFGTKRTGTIGNLDLSSGQNKIKIFIDGTTSFLKVGIANLVYNSNWAFSSITEARFGGNLGDCKWDDTSCSIGPSRVKYVPFVGTFYGVTIDHDVKQTFASIFASSNDKAVANAMDCTTFTCENEGKCAATEGIISCTTCPTGFTGFNCDKYSGVSFNGYTSSYTSQADISVPLSVTEQSLLIEFDKSAEEVGEIAKLTLGDSCTLAIHAAGGDNYMLEDQPVVAAGSSLTVTFDGTTAKIGHVSAPCTWGLTPISSVVSVVLGGSDPAPDSGVTKAAARYQGCIKKVSVNGVDLLVKSDALTNVDTEKCVTNNLPPNPCTSNPCENAMPCSTNADDYSASCTCKVPYIEDALCNFKNYCDGGHDCAINGVCKKFDSIAKCKETLDASKCGETGRWYYYCKCKEGWQGDNCSVEKDTEEPVKSDGNSTTIIVVIVVVAVVIGVVAVVIIVKKRKNVPAANGASNGKSKGTYSPQAQEKDLELAGKTEEAPAKNIYDDHEVIKNPNAESPVVAEASAPEPAPPAQEETAPPAAPPADTTVTIEPEGDTGSRGPEGPPPDPI